MNSDDVVCGPPVSFGSDALTKAWMAAQEKSREHGNSDHANTARTADNHPGNTGYTAGNSYWHAAHGEFDALEMGAASDLFSIITRALEHGVQEVIERYKSYCHEFSRTHHDKTFMDIHCSCHAGFYSNTQVIANLLHVVVQLALFPRPGTSEVGLQSGGPKCTDMDRGCQAVKDVRTGIVQTDAPLPRKGKPGKAKSTPVRGRAPPSVVARLTERDEVESDDEQPRHRRDPGDQPPGVRIGGGYHVYGTPPRQRSPSPDPIVSPRSVCDDSRAHPYAHGAISESTAPQRYAVGGYVTDRDGVEEVLFRGADQLRSRSPEELRAVQLYRVLTSRNMTDSDTPSPVWQPVSPPRDTLPAMVASALTAAAASRTSSREASPTRPGLTEPAEQGGEDDASLAPQAPVRRRSESSVAGQQTSQRRPQSARSTGSTGRQAREAQVPVVIGLADMASAPNMHFLGPNPGSGRGSVSGHIRRDRPASAGARMVGRRGAKPTYTSAAQWMSAGKSTQS